MLQYQSKKNKRVPVVTRTRTPPKFAMEFRPLGPEARVTGEAAGGGKKKPRPKTAT